MAAALCLSASVCENSCVVITGRHVWHWTTQGGRPTAARLARWRATAQAIVRYSEALRDIDDSELLKRGREVRWRAKAGTPLAELLPAAFALVRESARRELGYQHFVVQLMGGIALFEGQIAEMQTGEG